MIPYDILLYSQSGAWPNCHQHGFTQHLRGKKDAEVPVKD